MDAKTIYTPRDIMNDASKTYGVTMSYGKAWRARECALERILGDPEDSYNKLTSYLYMLRLKNPGTMTQTKTNVDNQFEYMFMALGASLQGWKHCKPVVVVDAIFLTGRYGGTLFTACTQDADYNIFVLAFGVGDAENNSAWEWFLMRFKEAYGERIDMCIISKSIENAIEQVYPNVTHGFCSYHLLQNVKRRFGKVAKHITKPFNAAVRSYTILEFEYQMKQLDNIHDGIRSYLDEKVGYCRWSIAHMPVNRYSTMASNIVELVNVVTKSVKNYPIVTMLESLRNILQEWFYKNRNKACSTFTRLATKNENMLRSNSKSALKLKVLASSNVLYQVSDDNTQNLVDMEKCHCTCNIFQVDGIPCKHVLSVIRKYGMDTYKYCSRYHTRESYIAAYDNNIVPLGDQTDWTCPNSVEAMVILVPNISRKLGRPKEKRYKSAGERNIVTKCRRCGQHGHNKRTCKHPLVLNNPSRNIV